MGITFKPSSEQHYLISLIYEFEPEASKNKNLGYVSKKIID
jgi:hypothetical protein